MTRSPGGSGYPPGGRYRRPCRRLPSPAPDDTAAVWVLPGPRGGQDRVPSANVSRAPLRRGYWAAGRRTWRRVWAAAAVLTTLTLVSGCGLGGGATTISAAVPHHE